MTHEALKLALEALENLEHSNFKRRRLDALIAIKQVLAQPAPVQGPVFSFQLQLQPGWGGQYPKAQVIGQPDIESLFGKIGDIVTFYTTPPAAQPQRPWVGLTDEEIYEADPLPGLMLDQQRIDFARAVEAKLKEKNT